MYKVWWGAYGQTYNHVFTDSTYAFTTHGKLKIADDYGGCFFSNDATATEDAYWIIKQLPIVSHKNTKLGI